CGAGVTHQLTIQVGTPYCGDCTGDGDINLGDVVYLIGYLYKQGPPPDPLCRGDVNADGSRDVGDVVLLINYLFKSSFAPCFDCCP
ncbi:MAG: dockerin type I repeat-containing protein, partial [Candidatus Zixiibacteriota bacterium]